MNYMLKQNFGYIYAYYTYIWVNITVKKIYDINSTFLWKVIFYFVFEKNMICLCALKQHDIVKVKNKGINEYIKETQTSNRSILT